MLLHPVVAVITPVVPQCTGKHQLPSANPREFNSLVMGGCWAANFTLTHTHHVTHVVTESLQCGVVTWNFCGLEFVTNFVYYQIPLLCVWYSSVNMVLVTRKGQLMKIWAQITTTKSIGKSRGKSIADTFCETVGIGIADSFIRKYRYRRWHLRVPLTSLVLSRAVVRLHLMAVTQVDLR